jgi:hypothetical protein
MVSKSKELRFGVFTARVPNGILVVLKELLIANGAEIFRADRRWRGKRKSQILTKNSGVAVKPKYLTRVVSSEANAVE